MFSQRFSLFLPFLAGVALAATREDTPATHAEMTQALISLLSETETMLNACRDEDSVQAAIPRLQELSQLAHRLSDMQNALPEPTGEDYRTAQTYADTFALLWKGIRDHLERLEQSGLMSEELRSVLRVEKP